MTITAGFTKRRTRWIVLFPLLIGVVVGFGLDSLGLLPVPQVAFRWTVPALTASQYVPNATLQSGQETVLIYVGSSTCGWSNVPELVTQIRSVKARIQARARSEGTQFATIGIARDRLAKDGLAHLDKFGPFDEVMAGHSWGNRGIHEYIYGEGDLAGPAATPQVIVVSRTLEVSSGHVSIVDERVLLRKTGLVDISEWISQGAHVPSLDG